VVARRLAGTLEFWDESQITRDRLLFIGSKISEAAPKLESLLIVLELIRSGSSLKPLLIVLELISNSSSLKPLLMKVLLAAVQN
jgi:hypothetical protein